MIQRCHNPKHERYAYYGGRGIVVCDRWRIYANFLADMGEAPDGLWLDRINNDGNYEPGNCRWSTPKEQASNRRRKSCNPNSMRSKARAAGLPYMVVMLRLRSGWTEHEALTIPKLAKGQQKPAT